MKYKGSLEKFGLKKLAAVSAGLFGCLFVLRIYQLFCLTDPATGFFTDHANITVPVFYVLAVASVLAVVILAFLASGTGSGETEDKRDIFHAVTSLLFAVPLFSEGMSGFRALSSNMAAFGSFKAAVSETGGYINIVAPVFAVLSAVVLAVNFISFVSGKMIIRKLKILSLCPALWAFFVTINYFKITASYVKVTQLMLTIFADAFLMIFLLEYARFISGIGIKEAMWSFYGTGIVSAALLLTTELPNLAFKLFAPEKLIVDCGFRAYNLIAALFVITAMCYASRNAKKITG